MPQRRSRADLANRQQLAEQDIAEFVAALDVRDSKARKKIARYFGDKPTERLAPALPAAARSRSTAPPPSIESAPSAGADALDEIAGEWLNATF